MILGQESHKRKEYHLILQGHTIPSGLCMIGKNSSFNKTVIQNTLLNCFKIISSQKSETIPEAMSWLPQSPYLSPIELTWDELDMLVHRE